MRIVLCGSAADWSIIDVEHGWHQALLRAGHKVYLYHLRNRIKMHSTWFQVMADGAQCHHCGQTVIEPTEDFETSEGLIVDAASTCVVHEAIRFQADLVMVVSGCSFHPNASAMLQRIGIPVVSILTECPYEDARMGDLAKTSSAIGVNDLASLDYFRSLVNVPVLYLPTAYDSARHMPGLPEIDKRCDVILVGTGFEERVEILSKVNWDGIDFRLGGFWPTEMQEIDRVANDGSGGLRPVRIGGGGALREYATLGPLDNDDTIRWYRSAKIVLAIHRDDHRARSLGPRVYEAAALGAFQLCDDSRADELADVFGDTIPTYRAGDPESLERAVRYWLEHPAERAQLAEASAEYVRGHSYDDRLATLTAALGASTAPRSVAAVGGR